MSDAQGSLSPHCEDEYDSYLLHVVGIFCAGGSSEEATAYLTGIASEHMRLSVVDPQAAAATSDAIATYLAFLPDGPKAVR